MQTFNHRVLAGAVSEQTPPELTAQSNAGATGANSLDLSGSFTELGFEGFVDISQEADAVIYSFKKFTIRFIAAPDERFNKHIDLDSFSILAAQKIPEESTRDFIPISLALDLQTTSHTLSDIRFQIPTSTVITSKYLMFGVHGNRTMQIFDEQWVRTTGRTRVDRAVWPISAKGNRWLENPEREHPTVHYKVPADPNDPCAPERIR